MEIECTLLGLKDALQNVHNNLALEYATTATTASQPPVPTQSEKHQATLRILRGSAMFSQETELIIERLDL